MNKKYINIKKLLVTTALLSTITAQSVLGYALDKSQVEAKPINIAVETETEMKTTLTGARNFPDLAGFMWAKPAIDKMVARGIIVGNEDGTFKPGANVTRQEFAAMAISAFGNIDQMIAKADELAKSDPSMYTSSTKIYAKYPNNWAKKVITAVQTVPILDKTWGISATSWEQNATRGDMAMIVLSIAEANGQTFNIKDGIEGNLADFVNVKGTMAETYILKAYSNGILVGDENGNYNPRANALRAEAAVIMNAAVNPSDRANVVVKPKPVVPVNPGDNVGTYGTVYPKEGDQRNGQVISRDANTGVLGFGNGQKGGIYLGTKVLKADGSVAYTIQVGSKASDNYGGMVIGDKYQDKHGYIFWGHEWTKIEGVASRRAENQVKPSASTVGTKADIYGNILKPGDTEPAFFSVREVMDYYDWLPLQ